MYFKLYTDSAGEWRWTLHAGNNEKIADSSEGYKSKGDAQRGIDLVKSADKDTPVR